MKWGLALGFVLFAAFGVPRAYAKTGHASLVPLPTGNPKLMPSLRLKTPEIQSDEPGHRVTARIEGNLPVADTTLLLQLLNENGGKYIRVSLRGDDGHFEVTIPLSQASTALEFTAIDPYGKVSRQRGLLYVSDWESLTHQAPSLENKSLGFDIGLSGTYISLTETNQNPFSEYVLTGKVGYTHSLFAPRWLWGANVFATLLPLSRSEAVQANFLGANLKVGYQLPGLPEPWRLTLWLGWYYSTMFVTDDQFGYQNVMGPEFYLALERAIASHDTIQAHLKISMIGDNAPNFAIENHELAAGLTYSHLLRNGHPLGVTLDGSLFSLTSPTANVVDIGTGSLGAFYGF